MEKCYLCRSEMVFGEEITIGPAEHLSEDVVVCMGCITNKGIDRVIRQAEGMQKTRAFIDAVIAGEK